MSGTDGAPEETDPASHSGIHLRGKEKMQIILEETGYSREARHLDSFRGSVCHHSASSR